MLTLRKLLANVKVQSWLCLLAAAAFAIWLSQPDPLAPATCMDYVAAKHASDKHNVIVLLVAALVVNPGLRLVLFLGKVSYNAYAALRSGVDHDD